MGESNIPRVGVGSGVIVGFGMTFRGSGGIAFDADRPDSLVIKKPMAFEAMGFFIFAVSS
ncbi:MULTISPECIES: hypothetical protein [Pseudomonas]|uniref:hypothetical protein n=1 Tax=Pseudomonas sp. BF-R-19 TaxID=2832397 RepID=UPI001CBAA8B0|nr:hypothetical protein [Pseudomonas sp. BF-R-19]